MPANGWLAAAVPARDGHHRRGEAAARGIARLVAHGRNRGPQQGCQRSFSLQQLTDDKEMIKQIRKLLKDKGT